MAASRIYAITKNNGEDCDWMKSGVPQRANVAQRIDRNESGKRLHTAKRMHAPYACVV